MVSLNDIKNKWEKIVAFVDSYTPHNETTKKIEEKTKVPFHYIMMAIALLVITIMKLLIPQRLLYTYGAFFIALLCCTRSISQRKDEEKWAAYWFFFVLVQLLPTFLDDLMYYSFVKFVVLFYLAVFDDCKFLLEICDKAYAIAHAILDKYRHKFCEESEEKTDEKTD